MENFSLNLSELPRTTALFPPLKHLAYKKQDNQSNRPSRRGNINFGIVLSSRHGRMGYRIGEKIFETEIPAFVFTYPGPEYLQIAESPLEKLYFSYDTEYMDLFRVFIDTPGYVLLPFRHEFDLNSIIGELFHLSGIIQLPGTVDRMDACCMRLVQEIMLNLPQNRKDHTSAAAEIYRIASYFDLHFTESPDPAEIAKKHGMSYRTFLRHWNSLFSETPAEYIRKRKLDEAKRLLLDTDLKIYEIAELTGFSDPYYFMRLFHSVFGITPKRFRNRT